MEMKPGAWIMVDLRDLFSLLLACGWLVVGALQPAAGQEPRTITLEEALDRARAHSPALEQAQNAAAASRSAVRREQQWFLPSVLLNMSPSQRYGLAFDQTAGRLVQQRSEIMGLSLSAGLPLFDGFERQASIRQARARHRSDQMNRERREETVVFEVLSRYLSVIEAREQLRIQEETLADEEQQLARTEELTAAGAQPITDLYQQQSAVAGRKLSVNQAERSLMTARSELIALLGLDQSGEYRFEAPRVDTARQDVDTRLSGLVTRARRQRADIQARQSEVRAAEEAIQIARASRWPRLSISGSAGTSYTSTRPNSFGDQFSDNRSGSIRLGLQIPLFQDAGSRQQITEAEIAHRNAELQLEQLRRETAKEVRQAYENYRLALEALNPAEEQLAAAERALQSADQRYDIGEAAFNELSTARQAYVQARSQYQQTLYEAVFQRRVLAYYTGQLNARDFDWP